MKIIVKRINRYQLTNDNCNRIFNYSLRWGPGSWANEGWLWGMTTMHQMQFLWIFKFNKSTFKFEFTLTFSYFSGLKEFKLFYAGLLQLDWKVWWGCTCATVCAAKVLPQCYWIESTRILTQQQRRKSNIFQFKPCLLMILFVTQTLNPCRTGTDPLLQSILFSTDQPSLATSLVGLIYIIVGLINVKEFFA